MFGNVLTPWGLLLRLTEFILPPPHPSVKEMDPRGAISYDQFSIQYSVVPVCIQYSVIFRAGNRNENHQKGETFTFH